MTAGAHPKWRASSSHASIAGGHDSGSPIGSALAGDRAFVARARRFKALFGGGMRQAGIIAAGALHALDHHRARLADDHARARRFADALAASPGVAIDAAGVETNIVRFRVPVLGAPAFVERCHALGLFMLPGGLDAVRAVFHLGIDDEATTRAIAIVEAVLCDSDGGGHGE